ncbi:MarR family transcriptional regulator [Pseudonocardia sp.]|uniref:MarR family transcriptional regulator n=1 Tax=Pseudonocardia sp. TaxID=60912 RepID=UPI0026334A26|nr:MarR family transcriptional regulator [Pseudonocardia sp.]
MSIDTTLPDNPNTAEHDGDNQPATDRAATAADHLWAALHARPGGTAEELSADAGIGRSTAAKILARWVAEGTAARVPTEGKRSASRFAIPTPDDATPADITRGTASATADPPGAQQTPSPDTAPAATTADTGTEADADRDGHHHDGTDGVPAAEAGSPDVPPDADSAVPEPVDGEPGTATTSEPDVAADTPVDDGSDGTAETEATRAVVTGRSPRLAPGALHGMVEDYLRDHPDEEFGPTKIGHELGRSTGAVGNALERLVTSGYAVRTKDRPKRYALAKTEGSDDGSETVGDTDG